MFAGLFNFNLPVVWMEALVGWLAGWLVRWLSFFVLFLFVVVLLGGE